MDRCEAQDLNYYHVHKSEHTVKQPPDTEVVGETTCPRCGERVVVFQPKRSK